MGYIVSKSVLDILHRHYVVSQSVLYTLSSINNKITIKLTSPAQPASPAQPSQPAQPILRDGPRAPPGTQKTYEFLKETVDFDFRERSTLPAAFLGGPPRLWGGPRSRFRGSEKTCFGPKCRYGVLQSCKISTRELPRLAFGLRDMVFFLMEVEVRRPEKRIIRLSTTDRQHSDR